MDKVLATHALRGLKRHRHKWHVTSSTAYDGRRTVTEMCACTATRTTAGPV